MAVTPLTYCDWPDLAMLSCHARIANTSWVYDIWEPATQPFAEPAYLAADQLGGQRPW